MAAVQRTSSSDGPSLLRPYLLFSSFVRGMFAAGSCRVVGCLGLGLPTRKQANCRCEFHGEFAALGIHGRTQASTI